MRRQPERTEDQSRTPRAVNRQVRRDRSEVRSAELDADRPASGSSAARLQRRFGNRAVQRLVAAESPAKPDPAAGDPPIQPKLAVGDPGDRYEREAERVAEQVVDGGGEHGRRAAVRQSGEAAGRLQRMCPRCRRRHRAGNPLNCEECEAELRRTPDDGAGGLMLDDGASPTGGDVAAAVRAIGGGRPLRSPVQSFFEAELGYHFGGVRIHTGPQADEAARAVNARAFTYGQDVVFRSSAYRPGTNEGTRLLAHELTHVIQQGRAEGSTDVGAAVTGDVAGPTLQGQFIGGHPDPMEDPRMHPEGAPKATTPTGACNIPAECPNHFCTPFSNASYARHQRHKLAPTLLAGIAIAVSPKVVSIWRDYLFGGASKQDFSTRFGTAFAQSKTTAMATKRLQSALETDLAANPPTLGASGSTTVDIGSRISSFHSWLRTPGTGMNFNIPGEIPGNLAGDIATDQTACPMGAKPSPIDDDRKVQGSVTVTRDGKGDLRVDPSIMYTVQDTVDLCPGNCGTSFEQFATIIMSQFEATGISGDVPFEVTFPAPLSPFTVTLPGGGSSGGAGGGASGSPGGGGP